MKKLLASIVLIVGVSAIVHAGTPQLRDSSNGSYSDTSFFGNTYKATISSNVTLGALPAKNSGGGSYSGRYCFDQILVQLPVATTGYIIDNSTTPTSTNSVAFIGAATTVPIAYNSPHLEPLCFGFGDSASLVILGSTPVGGGITYSGFTTYGSAGGSINNSGQ